MKWRKKKNKTVKKRGLEREKMGGLGGERDLKNNNHTGRTRITLNRNAPNYNKQNTNLTSRAHKHKQKTRKQINRKTNNNAEPKATPQPSLPPSPRKIQALHHSFRDEPPLPPIKSPRGAYNKSPITQTGERPCWALVQGEARDEWGRRGRKTRQIFVTD